MIAAVCFSGDRKKFSISLKYHYKNFFGYRDSGLKHFFYDSNLSWSVVHFIVHFDEILNKDCHLRMNSVVKVLGDRLKRPPRINVLFRGCEPYSSKYTSREKKNFLCHLIFQDIFTKRKKLSE